MAELDPQVVLHKSDVHFMYSGAVAKALLAAWVLSPLVQWAVDPQGFAADTREFRPGLIDGAVGLLFGLLTGLVIVRRMPPYLRRTLLPARGTFWGVRWGGGAWSQLGGFATLLLSCIVPGFLAGLAHSASRLGWPWFGLPAPAHGLAFTMSAGAVGMMSMMLYVLISYARWYDSLPD